MIRLSTKTFIKIQTHTCNSEKIYKNDKSVNGYENLSPLSSSKMSHTDLFYKAPLLFSVIGPWALKIRPELHIGKCVIK